LEGVKRLAADVLQLKMSFILSPYRSMAIANKPGFLSGRPERVPAAIPKPAPEASLRRVFLVGHPNVGKSAVFNLLTGEYAFVSNYPGTTVEVTRGTWRKGPEEIEIVDTPGVNSLAPHSDEEWVTVNMLRGERPDVVVQVADAKNLRRSLLLTLQLAELDLPLILVLNMLDEAEKLGLQIDTAALGAELGIDVVFMVATQSIGRDELLRAMEKARVPRRFRSNGFQPGAPGPPVPPRSNGQVEPAEAEESFSLESSKIYGEKHSTRVACLQAGCPLTVNPLQRRCGWPQNGNGSSPLIHAWRQATANALAESVLRVAEASSRGWPCANTVQGWVDRMDGWLRRPATGWPILLAILAVTYLLVGVVAAQWAVDLLEKKLFGGGVVPGVKWLLGALDAGPFLSELLVGRFGVVSMGLTYALAILLPILAGFFLLFGWLEDSGYLPRLAILADRQLRRFGMNGKAVLPLVLGLGCDTMATLVTRVLSTRKERLITTLVLAVGIPCSAQLGVLMGLLAGSSFWGMMTVVATVGSQVVLVAYFSSKILPGKQGDFMLEIPPLRMPRWSNLLRKTAMRVRWFLGEALPLFVLGAVLLFFLDRWGWLGKMIAASKPLVVNWLGLPAEAATALLMGFLRRDYGAAGLFALARGGQLDAVQIIVAAVTLTLFLPCLANLLMIVKEFGGRVATILALFVIPFAVLVGGTLNHLMRWLLPALGLR